MVEEADLKLALKIARIWAVLLLAVSAHAAPAPATSLSTLETAITLEAGRSAPSVSKLNLSQVGAGWANHGAERLIDHVEIGGEIKALQWQYDASASRMGTDLVQFVYEASPLRLTWEWRVRAVSGPIEHTIQIQNLGPEEVWLPLSG